MKIAIVGAGIIGVTTAYELVADGHEVTVFERHGAAALGTSFANAGVAGPGYVTPWAAPGMPSKVARYLFARHAPVRLCWPIVPLRSTAGLPISSMSARMACCSAGLSRCRGPAARTV